MKFPQISTFIVSLGLVLSCGGPTQNDISVCMMYNSLKASNFNQAMIALDHIDKDYQYFNELTKVNILIKKNDFINAEDMLRSIISNNEQLKSTFTRLGYLNFSKQEPQNGWIEIGNRLYTGLKVYFKPSMDSYIGSISCYGTTYITDENGDHALADAIFIQYPNGKIEPKLLTSLKEWYTRVDDPAIVKLEYLKCK